MDTETIQKRGGTSRVVTAVATVAIVAVAVFGGWWAMNDREESMSPVEATTASISQDDLAAAAQARVFLGHQSVGANLLEGIPAVYQGAGLTPPVVATDLSGIADGGVAHTYIGENTQPLGKIEAFNNIMRDGAANEVDVAAVKLCWIDFTPATDVAAVFATYQKTVDALARDYPDVAFLHITTPLTTESTGLKARIKGLLGRDSNAADNVVRQQYNEMMRQAYGDSGRLFDLAYIQSTAPDGTRASGEYQGDTYYALTPEYASDPGHLNAAGSQLVASKFLTLVAQQAGL